MDERSLALRIEDCAKRLLHIGNDGAAFHETLTVVYADLYSLVYPVAMLEVKAQENVETILRLEERCRALKAEAEHWRREANSLIDT